MGLKDAIKKLDTVVADLTSLHVQTFTGDLQIDVEGKTLPDLKAQISEAKAAGSLILVAETLSQFDGDSYNFVAKDMSAVPPQALEMHKNAITAGVETRLGLIELFKGILD
ncbi:hypothetical protein PPO43_13010 [Saprospira sp. CCB-QB6]|uniref:hypothetical protein n=1 Tax=Saprospira sp. CCB-QB6 TaxID=3023936 RepID=UPI00234AEEA2|nr:hypothetical protein [Saprospira sp. CCB-QB6]WCL80888.1 hypothetical protein PPO43_13010 [Saprospira sp. CCB-QB6]